MSTRTLVASMVAALLPTLAAAQIGTNVGKGLVEWGKKVGEEAYKQNYNMKDLKKDFDTLSPEDKDSDADYPAPAELPSECVANPEKCASCGFEKALADLQKTRYNLEKLRRVYASTKTMVGHALAVGDSMAGSAGVGGLAWVAERNKILESYKKVQSSYDNKYRELMDRLQQSLEALAKCEEQVYGEKDWYQRYGFMYYEFMAGRYERAD